MLDPAEVQGPTGHVIDHTSRRADDDIGPAPQARQLRTIGRAAVDRQHGDVIEPAGVGGERLGHLESQLTGRRQHQSFRQGALSSLIGVAGHQRQRRQGESSGLARAGLGQPDDVAPLRQQRDGLRLDRRGRLIAELVDDAQDTVVKAQVSEPGPRFFLLPLQLIEVVLR